MTRVAVVRSAILKIISSTFHEAAARTRLVLVNTASAAARYFGMSGQT
jgi:hypothetical protein